MKTRRQSLFLVPVILLLGSCGPQMPFQTKDGDDVSCNDNMEMEASCFKDWNTQVTAALSAKYESLNAMAEVFRIYNEVKNSGALVYLAQWRKQQEAADKSVKQQHLTSVSHASTDHSPDAFMLLQAGNGIDMGQYAAMLTSLSNIMRAQGENIAARGSFLMNLAQVNKSVSEVDGLKIRNIGDGLKNVGIHLDNVEKAVDIYLKQHYAAAYSSYVRSFQGYAELMETTYARQFKAATATIRLITHDLRNYDRQMSICMTRAKRIWEMGLSEANEEMANNSLSYRNISEQFSGFSSRPYGEQCLHRVLLTSHSANDDIFNNLSFRVTPTQKGNVVGIKCPLRSQGLPDATVEDIPFHRFFDLMEYPEYVRAKEEGFDEYGNKVFKNQVIGVYRPATMYQFYRLMTNRTYQVNLNPPVSAENDRDRCEFVKDGELFDSKHRDRIAYFDYSRRFEEELAEFIKVEDERLLGSYSTYPSIDKKSVQISQLGSNKSYKTLLDRLDEIFAKVEGCIATEEERRNLHNQANPSGNSSMQLADGEVVAGAAPTGPDVNVLSLEQLFKTIVVGKPTESSLSVYHSSKFPKASESIRMCAVLAEEHRVKAFQKLNLINDVQENLERLAHIKPPRAPHPVQFEPAEGNLQNAGNDFPR